MFAGEDKKRYDPGAFFVLRDSMGRQDPSAPHALSQETSFLRGLRTVDSLQRLNQHLLPRRDFLYSLPRACGPVAGAGGAIAFSSDSPQPINIKLTKSEEAEMTSSPYYIITPRATPSLPDCYTRQLESICGALRSRC